MRFDSGAANLATGRWVVSSAKLTGAGPPPAELVASLRIVNPGTTEALLDLTCLLQAPAARRRSTSRASASPSASLVSS